MRHVTTTLLLKRCSWWWHVVALVLIWWRVRRVRDITILPWRNLTLRVMWVPLCLWYKLSRCYQCLRQNGNQNSKYIWIKGWKKNNALLEKDFTLVMETDGLRPCEDAVVVILCLVGIGWFKEEAEYPGSSSLVCLFRCYNIWKTQALYIKILISAIYIKRHLEKSFWSLTIAFCLWRLGLGGACAGLITGFIMSNMKSEACSWAPYCACSALGWSKEEESLWKKKHLRYD